MIDINEIDLSKLSYREKMEMLEILEELERRNAVGGHLVKIWPDEGPLAYYNYPKHMEFMAAGREFRERFASYSNRAGKSVMGAYESACHLTGQYPHWWQGRTFDKPIEMWACGDTSQTTRDIVQKELLGPPGAEGTGMIAKDLIANMKKKAGVPDAIESFKVKHVSGGWSYCGFKSYDQGRRSFQGTAKEFCVTSDTEVLTDRGWVTDPKVGDKVLSYKNGSMEWANINYVHRYYHTGDMYRLSSRNNFEIEVTPGHRWLVYNKKTKKTYFTTTSELKKCEQLIVSGNAVQKASGEITPEEAALVGWIMTDGTIKKSNMLIYQSLSYNAEKCRGILEILEGGGFEYNIKDYPYDQGILRRFNITGQSRKRLLEFFGEGKTPTQAFINDLGTEELLAFLHAVIDGDGMWHSSGSWAVTSTRQHHIDVIQQVAMMLGYRTIVTNNGSGSFSINAKTTTSSRYNYRRVSVENLDITKFHYDGEVYCPSSDLGLAVYRTRDKKVLLSGNCWLDEEPPLDVYGEALVRTMTTNGMIIVTATPLKGLTPFVQSFMEQANKDMIDWQFNIGENYNA